MEKVNNINHEGVIIDIDSDFISVKILSQAACSSCSAKSICTMSEAKTKVIQVENKGFTLYDIGEKVNVLLKKNLGFKALWISYLIPLVILLVLLLALSALGVKELSIGIYILVALVIYFFLVYILRDRISKEFIFTIEKLEK